MHDYVKLSLQNKPDHFILHVATIDLVTEALSEEIAAAIIDVTTLLKNEQHHVSISNIILRADNQKLNIKRNEVNKHLSELCQELSKTLALHISECIKIELLGDFSIAIDEEHMSYFCDSYSLKNLTKQPTCYKNPDKLTSIDFTLTNVPKSFQGTCVLETGLSDFHLMKLTVMQKNIKKLIPKIVTYRP